MKILQVITSLRMGGAEKLIADMVPLYREHGYEADVLLFDGSDTPLKKELEEKMESGCFRWGAVQKFIIRCLY